VHEVKDEVNFCFPAGGLGFDQLDLVAVPAGQHHPGAQVPGVAGPGLPEGGGDDLAGAAGGRAGQLLRFGVRAVARSRSVRVRSHAQDMNMAGADLDHEEHVDATQGNCAVYVEEITRQHGRGLDSQELLASAAT